MSQNTHNLFKLGPSHRPSSKRFDQYCKTHELNPFYDLGRNFEDLWNVRHLNLGWSRSLVPRILKAFGHDENSGRGFHIEKTIFVTDNTELAAEIYRHLRLDFVHDLTTGLTFIDMFAAHEVVMGQLYFLKCPKEDNLMYSDAAEKYVEKGLGFYKSSQSTIVWRGPDMIIPEWFRKFKNDMRVMT